MFVLTKDFTCYDNWVRTEIKINNTCVALDKNTSMVCSGQRQIKQIPLIIYEISLFSICCQIKHDQIKQCCRKAASMNIFAQLPYVDNFSILNYMLFGRRVYI